jgi:hypothetical protein
VAKLFCFKQARSSLRGVCIPRTWMSTKALFSVIFFTLID